MNDPYETLDRIRKRANAATEGPWERHQYEPYPGRDRGDVSICGRQGNVTVAYWYYDDEYETADAEFIAHARTDVPWLLEQVDRRDKALEKVLRLHPRVVVLHADPEFGRMEDDAICGACIVNHEPADWPCPTVRAITAALNGGDQ